jgi:CBS domain-containing protein
MPSIAGTDVSFHLHLDSETVDHAHPSEPLCVEPQLAVRDVLRRMKDQSREAVLVCRDGVLVGIFTERDVLRLLAAGADFDVPVQQVMSNKPETISVRETVGSAISKMSTGGFRHLPIVDQLGRPVGLLQVSTILHYLVEHFPKFIYNLPPKPHHATQQREGA